jgi:hypothetical protein
MAWWIDIVCRRHPGKLTPEGLLAGITARDDDALAGIDYFTLAEDYDLDLDDDQIEAAMDALRITPGLEIHFRPDPALRPIAVWVTDDAARVAARVAEIRDNDEPPAGAEPYLEACAAIVALELGFPMLENLGVVIAYEVARYLAQKGDAIIRDDDGRWQRIVQGAFETVD